VSHIPEVSDERVVKNIVFIETTLYPKVKAFLCVSAACPELVEGCETAPIAFTGTLLPPEFRFNPVQLCGAA